MCIIIYCKPYTRPSHAEVAACWLNNPDGGGFMYPKDGRVKISKGFMTLPDYLAALETPPIDAPLLLHMRVATSGGAGAGVTHPFPISDVLSDLHSLDALCRAGLAHNGVLPAYAADAREGVSDTVAFIRKVAAPLSRDPRVRAEGGIAASPLAKETLAAASAGSRLAIMDGTGNVALTGAGWTAMRGGLAASNDSYRRI